MRPTTLRADRVDVRYDRTHPVLRSASLTLRRGSRVAVVGANGAGKTTLLRVMSGAVKPDGGDVRIDEVALRRDRRSLAHYRAQVQLVLQDPSDQLFSADVYADVSFGPTNLGLPADQIRDRVEESLRMLGATELIDRPTHELSFGERKRIAIAGAVAMRPAFLLLDEPTAGLDPSGVEALLSTLEDLEAEGTVLMLSTHDLALAWQWAAEVAVVRRGEVIQAPAHRALMDSHLLRSADLRPPWEAELLRRAGYVIDPDHPPRTVDEIYSAVRPT